MEILIKKARIKDAESCLDCVRYSLIWDAYYKDVSVLDLIVDAIKRKEIYIALNKNDNCIGFMGIVPKGCFAQFPYLSILAVKKKYRNRSIGKLLLEKFESLAFKESNRAFVLCSDFNKEAHRFYKRYDYKKCGEIPNLYKEGINELIFVKENI